MATSPSALTSDNTQPSDGGQGGQGDFSPSQMAGADPSAQAQAQPQGPSLSQATEQVRSLEQSLLSLAQQFPAAAQDIRKAIDAVRSVAKRIVSTPGMQEPQSPRSLG